MVLKAYKIFFTSIERKKIRICLLYYILRTSETMMSLKYPPIRLDNPETEKNGTTSLSTMQYEKVGLSMRKFITRRTCAVNRYVSTPTRLCKTLNTALLSLFVSNVYCAKSGTRADFLSIRRRFI